MTKYLYVIKDDTTAGPDPPGKVYYRWSELPLKSFDLPKRWKSTNENQRMKINQWKSTNENQPMKINQLKSTNENQPMKINQLKSTNENQTMKINQWQSNNENQGTKKENI